jgi:hypothetical protein
MAIDWANMKKIEFQALKRACVTHEIDKCQRDFNISKNREAQHWVGFGFIDHGRLTGKEILVYDKAEDAKKEAKKKKRKKKKKEG